MRLFHSLQRQVALMAVVTIPICLVTAQAATGTEPDEPDQAKSGYSVAALFNVANADARQGKVGLAILNYERALILQPNDADITANLHFVRAKAGLPDTPENWLTRDLAFARPNTLAWLGCFGVVFAGTSLLLVGLFPRRRLAFRVLTFVGVLFATTAIGSAITIWPRVHEAIVIARNASGRTSPVRAAEPAFKLREGESVTVGAEHQEFMLVRTPAGRSGWVARSELVLVVPQSSGRFQTTHRT